MIFMPKHKSFKPHPSRGLVYIVYRGNLADMITFAIQTHKTLQFRLTMWKTTRTRRSKVF